MFQLYPLRAFQDNYIWMLQHPSHPGLAVAVDPGQSAPVEEWLKRHHLKLAAILVTHHHPDHTGGIQQLADPETPVYGPVNSPFKGITLPVSDNDRIELLGQSLRVKSVPGHTLDHIAYYTDGAHAENSNQSPSLEPDSPQLFCGDTLFIAGCGRLFEGSAEQLQQAMFFFRGLNDQTQVCCAHEYSLSNLSFATAVEPDNVAIQIATERCQKLRSEGLATVPGQIGEEKQINPFMRYDQPSVIQSAERLSGKKLTNDALVLAAIRQWKDHF
tara:strand:+ start:5024 stop:5839 length:816 start_codon:yes stop_codon:yes gene_type:complete